jgi:cardiolipin synthase
MIKLIPDILSFFRLAASFALIPLVLKNDFTGVFVLLTAAAVSDFFDGYIARKFQASSEFGAMLDPLADKALMIISYALFARMKFIPICVTATVIARDVLILLTVMLCKFRKVDLKIQPLQIGKISTAIQLIFIIFVSGCNAFAINIQYSVEAGAAIVIFFTIFSGAKYVQKYYRIRHKIFAR